MAIDEEYNGWSNRETWAINLHLENNEGDYRQACEAAEAIVREESDLNGQVGGMAEWVKNWTEEVFDCVLDPEREMGQPTQEALSFVSDVGSWWRADFYEIAQGWIDNAREIVEAEDADPDEREDDSHAVLENG